MSEPTEQTQPPQSVEDLASIARSEAVCAKQAEEQADHHREQAAKAATELAERVGRPGAAKLLGITPRELAGILRAPVREAVRGGGQ